MNEPLKAYYSHYLYHSDADIVDLKSFKDNGAGLCYPLNSYWFNNPLTGTAARLELTANAPKGVIAAIEVPFATARNHR